MAENPTLEHPTPDVGKIKHLMCVFHCTHCDRHFTSEKGFTAHILRGSHRNPPGKRWRTRDGFCKLTLGSIGESVTAVIWTSA